MFLLFWYLLGATCRLNSWAAVIRFNRSLSQGWMDPEWFRHFVSFVKPSKKYHVILTLDGHYPHSRNIEVIDYVRENRVHIVCLLRISLMNCNLFNFSTCSVFRHITYRRQKFGWTTIQTELLHIIELLEWLGKLTWNRPQQSLLQTVSGKLAFDKHDSGRISAQHHELFAWKPCSIYRHCRRTAYR
jgi:hypothetical protein